MLSLISNLRIATRLGLEVLILATVWLAMVVGVIESLRRVWYQAKFKIMLGALVAVLRRCAWRTVLVVYW
jgi:hypothetical protein